MKLNNEFVIKNVAGTNVAMPVGDSENQFNGVIKLNSVGEFIFKLLENETDIDSVVKALTENYDVSAETAKNSAEKFIDELRKSGLLSE